MKNKSNAKKLTPQQVYKKQLADHKKSEKNYLDGLKRHHQSTHLYLQDTLLEIEHLTHRLKILRKQKEIAKKNLRSTDNELSKYK